MVARADAQFDPAKQTNDVETALALKPSAILTLIVDPVAGAEAFRRANAAGVKLVLADNGAQGFVAGKDYVGIVTGDHIGMGRAAAQLMNDALGGKGAVGFIYHDAEFFVTNNRDGAFRAVLEKEYPGLVIVDAKGFTAEPQTFDIASAMLQQHPEIKGIYVAWDVAAEGRGRGAARRRPHRRQDRHPRPRRQQRARHGQGRVDGRHRRRHAL